MAFLGLRSPVCPEALSRIDAGTDARTDPGTDPGNSRNSGGPPQWRHYSRILFLPLLEPLHRTLLGNDGEQRFYFVSRFFCDFYFRVASISF